jgi:Zn-dependent protease
MNRRLRFGRIFGVELYVDWSWIVTFVLAAGTLVALDAKLYPELTAIEFALAGAVAAAGLFASLGAHEIIRVMAARGAGLPVRRLTLFVLGGVTDVERAPATPRTEVLGAIAAPAFSFVTALTTALCLAVATAPLPRSIHDLDRLGLPGVVLAEIAAANLVIAIVNLLPAYPLDGGRLLRAALWRATGNVDRATKYSAWTGQIVGWTLVIGGVAIALAHRHSLDQLGTFGVLCAAIGWFIASASAQGYVTVEQREA